MIDKEAVEALGFVLAQCAAFMFSHRIVVYCRLAART